MKRLHIVGRKNSGKTTLITDLVTYWSRQGLRVGTIKHTHHHHELDTPGKDSHRHRLAGADVVGILSPRLNAVFYQPDSDHDAPQQYDVVAPLFDKCDAVLVEGHSMARQSKIEVWRAATGFSPMACEDDSILAVVTDDPLPMPVPVPVLPRSDVGLLAQELIRWAGSAP
jgi:molybdopterin-guanine dinucleotide biosynthesis protein MobB